MKSVWRKCKRALVMALTVVLVGNSIDMSMLYVQAEQEQAFETVSENGQLQGSAADKETIQGSISDEQQVNTSYEGQVEGNTSDNNQAQETVFDNDSEKNTVSGGDAYYSGVEFFELPSLETSALPMGFFRLSNGTVELAEGNHVNWIDRIDLSEATFAKEFYNNLVEWTDNDGTEDLLIEDESFAMAATEAQKTITIATISGTLSGEDATQAGIEAKVSEIYTNYTPYLMAAYDAFDKDYPEVFWLGVDRLIGATPSGEFTEGVEASYTVELQLVLKGNVTVNGEQVAYDIRSAGYRDESAIKEAIASRDAKVKALVDEAANKTDLKEKLAYFNEQLTLRNEYNTSNDLNAIGNDCRECISSLTGMVGTEGPVCEGYARAFKVLCDEAGIPCVLVDGQASNSISTEAHMWNYVQMDDNKWYAVDVTWNDPKGGAAGAVSGGENAEWFLLGANTQMSSVNNQTFIETHPVTNLASSNGVQFTNGPVLNDAKYINVVAEVSVGSGTPVPYENIREAFAAADSSVGSTLKLMKNIKLSAGEDIDGSFTLDLNGYILDMAGNSLGILENGTLTIADSSAKDGGTGSGTINNSVNDVLVIWNEGVLTVNGGSFSNSGDNVRMVYNGGTMTIEEGSFSNSGDNAPMVYNEGTMTINGGSFSDSGCYSKLIENQGILTIKEGVLSGKGESSVVLYNVSGTTYIKGGQIEMTGTEGGIALQNDENGTVMMSAGVVKMDGYGNTLFNLGKVTVSGGVITTNADTIAAIDNYGTLSISGTPAISATADVAAINNVGTLNLSGAPVIEGADGYVDIELYNTKIVLTDELNGTDSYSVKLFDENYSECMGTFAVAGTDYTITEADKACFTSISDYDVILEEGVLKFGILPHEHTEETFSDKWPTTSGTVTTGAYYLAKDVTAESIICVEGDVKLCLNGYTLDMKDNYINLSSGATLTICDCSSEQTGKITGETTVIILNYGTFTLESGTLENTAESNGKVIFNEGTAIIMGGVIQVTGVEAYGINNWGNLKLSGGTIDVADDIGVFSSEGSTFELSGAPMITAGSCDLLIADNLNINITGELTGADTYTVECEGVIPRTFAVASEASILESSASKFVPVDEMQEVVSEDTTLVLDYQKMDIPVKVTSWEDDEDTELNRCVVAVNLYSDDGTFVKSVDLDEENQWTGSFADVYKYDADGEIEYTIELQYDGRYVATSQYSAEKGYEISMSLKHKHQLVYVNATSDGEVTTEITNVLQIICVNEEEKDNCQWTPETLQVSPPDYLESITYDGIAKSAISDCAFTTDATVSEIQYFVQSGSIWKSVAASEVVNAGTYKALVEVEDGEQTGVAQLIFEIEPAEMSVGVVAYSGEYDPFAGASAIEAVTVDIPAGIPDATVFYRIQEGDWEQNVPTIKGVGEMAVDVKVTAPNYKDYTTTVTAEMRPFDITYCEVVLEQDIYYYTGEAVKPKVVQLRTSAGVLPLTEDDLVISYENNIEISEEEPRVVKVAAVNTNYTGTASTCFMIAPYDGEVKMLYNGSETAEAWYNTDVAISAEGYTVSESITGPYTEQVVISEEGRELNKTLYFKQDGTGYITSEYPVVVNIDKTAPTFNGEGLGISIEDRFWNTLLNKITFGVFFNETKLVSISATDAFSGVESYYYYVDTTGNETVLSSGELDALDAVGRFAKSVSGQFEMADENKYVVYAYAVDMVGNKSAYICSDGVVMDTTAPVIKVTEPTEAAGTLKDTSATFVVEADEEVMIGVWIITDYSGEALEVKISADYDYWEGLEADKQIIKINDGQVCISYKTTAVANQTKEITITGLKPNTFYEYSVEVYDLAENENIFAGEEDSTVPGWYYMRPITTLKTMPVFDEEPVISGTYGQQLADMTLSQPVSTNGVAGSWNISSEDVTDMPQVTGNKTYTVTFTPEDEDNYAVITKQVIPTVAKKQVTITIDNQTVKYKEEIPGFTYTASGLVETEDTTVLNVDLSTTAVKGSSAGQYPIVGTYSSDNYTVSFNKATLTIEQAEGKLTIEAGKEAYAKTFGEEAFTLTGIQVVSDGTVVYTVADSQNAAGEAVAADKVITVDKEGRVTIQGTGTAKVVISVPETTNYTKAEASISVVVGKAAQENAVLTKNYVYNKDTADSVDLGACVPEDAGKVSYVVKSVAGTFTEAPVIKDEKLTYVISKGEKDATGKVVVEVSSENYETFTITVDMCLKYETKVVLKSGSEVTAKGSLTYGDTLAELSFGEAVFVEEGTDTVVVGTLSWAEPDSVPKVADTEAAWIFTPDSADYAVVSGKTAIVVNKAKQPELSIVPVGDAVYGQEGSICFEVTGGMDGTEITVTVPKDNGVVTEVNTNSASKFYAVPLNAGKVTVTAVSVEKSGNYEDATATYELTVAPVAMEADWLSWAGEFAGEDTYIGEALTPQVKAYFIADGILTKGKDYTVTYVNNTNAYTLTEADADFDATKAPAVVVTGKGNFAGTVKKYFVINKAQNAPNMPANTMTVENATDTVGKVSLPEGWVWQDAKQALAEGNTTLVIVVYDGADKGNYVNETVEVIITRLEAATPAPGGDNGSSTPTATPAPGGNSGSSTPTVTQAPVITTAPAEVITAPKTDDASMSEGWLVLMAMACVVVGMGSGMYYRRKREQ